MLETYLTHYVLDGGWAMLLLIPASVVVIASIIRMMIMIQPASLRKPDGAVSRVNASLDALIEQFGELKPDDVRQQVESEMLRFIAMLQPLNLISVCAPLTGLLGAITIMMAAFLEQANGGSAQLLSAALERSLIAPMWATAIAIISYAGLITLRYFIFKAEQNIVAPAARKHIAEKPGFRPNSRPRSREIVQ
jgi:hypothetical protein